MIYYLFKVDCISKRVLNLTMLYLSILLSYFQEILIQGLKYMCDNISLKNK